MSCLPAWSLEKMVIGSFSGTLMSGTMYVGKDSSRRHVNEVTFVNFNRFRRTLYTSAMN